MKINNPVILDETICDRQLNGSDAPDGETNYRACAPKDPCECPSVPYGDVPVDKVTGLGNRAQPFRSIDMNDTDGVAEGADGSEGSAEASGSSESSGETEGAGEGSEAGDAKDANDGPSAGGCSFDPSDAMPDSVSVSGHVGTDGVGVDFGASWDTNDKNDSDSSGNGNGSGSGGGIDK